MGSGVTIPRPRRLAESAVFSTTLFVARQYAEVKSERHPPVMACTAVQAYARYVDARCGDPRGVRAQQTGMVAGATAGRTR